jgi:hypothetical protein
MRAIRNSDHRPWQVVFMIGWLVYRLATPATSLAAATATCSEGPLAVNHWRGEALSAGQKHGTSGTVPGRILNMCTSPNPVLEIDGTFYFSNVEPASGSFRDIVQIGFGQGRSPTLSGGMHYVYAYGVSTSTPGCGSFQDRDPLTQQVGTYVVAQHDFKVYHQTNFWRLFVDSTQKVAIGEGNICWTPGKSSWFGETWDAGDQLGGTSTVKLPVTLMNYANAENGGFFWTNFNAAQACNYNTDPPAAYQCDITSTRSIDLWTNNR